MSLKGSSATPHSMTFFSSLLSPRSSFQTFKALEPFLQDTAQKYKT